MLSYMTYLPESTNNQDSDLELNCPSKRANLVN